MKQKGQDYERNNEEKERILEVCKFTTGKKLNFSYSGAYNLKCVFFAGIDIFKR